MTRKEENAFRSGYEAACKRFYYGDNPIRELAIFGERTPTIDEAMEDEDLLDYSDGRPAEVRS